MNNPYEQLYIYYFEGVPKTDTDLEQQSSYLGTWVDDEIAFLFFSEPCEDQVKMVSKANPQVRLADSYEMTGEQWHGDKIGPYFINNLHICPPWNLPEKRKEGDIRVVLDPGVVFGTGRHQTTEDCLYLIHRLCTKNRIQTMLDIGTGTGLLALGAAALGVERVMACDFNFLAVKTTRNNIGLNRFEKRVLAFQARGEQVLSITCDLLVANIHYDVMRHIIESPKLTKKKWIILSGLLSSEAQKVLSRLKAKGFHIVERRCPDGVWNTILVKPA